jgi:hypothetical protein
MSLKMDTSTNDFKFQEFCRVVGATTASYNYNGLINGTSCLFFIKSQMPYIVGYVSDPFYKLIIQEITLAEGKTNVREHVKKILTYPLEGYLPWKEHHYPITYDVSNVKFNIVIKDGKVHAFSSNIIAKQIFNLIHPPNTVINAENSLDTHITLVNSNVVADIGINKISEFITKVANTEFNIKLGNVKSTVSYDWPMFSDCYVIEVISDVISKFIGLFNEEFGKKINPTLHITFAVKPRSLF